jgi:hypothetical protein
MAAGVVRQMIQWIAKCVLDHGDCAIGAIRGDPPHAVVPKRLVEVDTNSPAHVRLVSLPEPVQYLALSYCWGTSKQQGTTKNNLAMRQSSIRVTDLPKTLQDAILVTQTLGLRHVWIDSICIIQDDKQDWAEESAKMADIYVGAHVVIAATQAADCAEGFLHTYEEPLRTRPSDFRSKGLEAFARRTITHDPWGRFELDTQPLYERAWAMQERELARRVIHFLPDEVVWRCRTTITCECDPSQNPKVAASRLLALCKTEFSNSSDDTSCSFGRQWTTIVRHYLKLKLTHSSDRLPALSGIIKCVQKKDTGKYIVGMWEKDIMYQLSWYHDPQHEPDHYIRPHSTEPTFSWITSPSPVLWPYASDGIMTRCQFISSTGTPATSNPYGPSRDCSITVRGPLLQGSKFLLRAKREKFRLDDSTIFWDRIAPIDCVDEPETCREGAPPTSESQLEGKDSISKLSTLFLLELYAQVWSQKSYTTSVVLLLKQDASEAHYTRAGLLHYFDPAWLEKDSVETTINIK